MYLVPKQYGICCVHVGVWIYHSVYITCVYITHTYIHTLLRVWKHIYTYSTTHSHIMQSHTRRLGSLNSMLLVLFTFSTQEVVEAHFSGLNRISWQKHSQLLLKSHTEEPKKKKKRVSISFPPQENVNRIQHTATCLYLKLFFSVLEHLSNKKWCFKTESKQQTNIRDRLAIYSRAVLFPGNLIMILQKDISRHHRKRCTRKTFGPDLNYSCTVQWNMSCAPFTLHIENEI